MQYDVRPDEQVSVAVVEAVSAHENRGPLSLPPLADVVDPDALNRLFSPSKDDGETNLGLVSFTYSSSHVIVDPNDGIMVDDGPVAEVDPLQ